MALKKADSKNFDSIRHAMKHDRCCLVESRDAKTGEYRALICAVNHCDDGQAQLAPLAQMITGNPYEDYVDPTVEELP